MRNEGWVLVRYDMLMLLNGLSLARSGRPKRRVSILTALFSLTLSTAGLWIVFWSLVRSIALVERGRLEALLSITLAGLWALYAFNAAGQGHVFLPPYTRTFLAMHPISARGLVLWRLASMLLLRDFSLMIIGLSIVLTLGTVYHLGLGNILALAFAVMIFTLFVSSFKALVFSLGQTGWKWLAMGLSAMPAAILVWEAAWPWAGLPAMSMLSPHKLVIVVFQFVVGGQQLLEVVASTTLIVLWTVVATLVSYRLLIQANFDLEDVARPGSGVALRNSMARLPTRNVTLTLAFLDLLQLARKPAQLASVALLPAMTLIIMGARFQAMQGVVNYVIIGITLGWACGYAVSTRIFVLSCGYDRLLLTHPLRTRALMGAHVLASWVFAFAMWLALMIASVALLNGKDMTQQVVAIASYVGFLGLILSVCLGVLMICTFPRWFATGNPLGISLAGQVAFILALFAIALPLMFLAQRLLSASASASAWAWVSSLIAVPGLGGIALGFASHKYGGLEWS